MGGFIRNLNYFLLYNAIAVYTLLGGIAYATLAPEPLSLPPIKVTADIAYIRREASIHTEKTLEELVSAPENETPVTQKKNEILKDKNSFQDDCTYSVKILDENYPDGTVVDPMSEFMKTWKIMNTGNCNISADVVYVAGMRMEGSPLNPKVQIDVGKEEDITVKLTSPYIPGTYRSTWMLSIKKPDGSRYLVTDEFWSEINISGKLGSNGRLIVVDISEQRLFAYEDGKLKYNFLVRTGRAQTPTPITPIDEPYTILAKYPSIDMDGTTVGFDYFLPNVPWDMLFKEGGYYLHGAPWLVGSEYLLGTPGSHGCVNLLPKDAETLYKWVKAKTDNYPGDPVIVVNQLSDLENYLNVMK